MAVLNIKSEKCIVWSEVLSELILDQIEFIVTKMDNRDIYKYYINAPHKTIQEIIAALYKIERLSADGLIEYRSIFKEFSVS